MFLSLQLAILFPWPMNLANRLEIRQNRHKQKKEENVMSHLLIYNNSKHNHMLSWSPGNNSQTTHPDDGDFDVIFTNLTWSGANGRLVCWESFRKDVMTGSGSIPIGEQLKVQNRNGDTYNFWPGDNGSRDNSIHCNMNG
jgi:hypothetical protein